MAAIAQYHGPVYMRLLRGKVPLVLDAGAPPTLHDRYGISAESIVAQIKAWLG